MNKILVFLGGIVFTCVVLVVVGRWAQANNQVLGVSTVNVQDIESNVKDKVQQGEKQGLSVISALIPNILQAISENPLLGPFIKTQREVGQAVTTVKNLPGDQRDAICNQICSN